MIIRSRNYYDTALIYLFILGKEHILPVELINSIPFSTRATWRKYNIDKFFGYHQRNILDEGIRSVELYHKYKHLKKVLVAVETIYITMANMLDFVKIPVYKVKEYRELVIDLIQQHKQVIDLDKLLEYFRISRSTYQSWLLELKVKCSDSPFSLCVRRYGSQLLKPQIEIIQEALTSDKYKHWPITSIALHFQRTGELHASANSWYKYRKFLGIIRTRFRKFRKTKGISSKRSNEYWHVDITHFKTDNGVKHYIYFLSDNFSRKIISWRLAFEVNWKYVKECIEESYSIAINIETPLNLNIITDGGPENIHHSLDEFIGSLVGNIKKSIALKDIEFSNSPAEAKNKTFKTYYASEQDTENTSQLIEKIKFFVKDFNSIRPNKPIGGFTPDEVYFNQKPVFDFAELRRIDALNRKETNKNTTCNACCNL